MLVRTVPLALCLLWLAYESRFSTDFFLSTLQTSVASIGRGMESVIEVERSAEIATILASNDGAGH